MLEESSHEKIILLDFGITKIFKDNLDTDVTAISYFYSSPEVSNIDKSRVTPKSDIFSFGMYLYLLLLIIFKSFV